MYMKKYKDMKIKKRTSLRMIRNMVFFVALIAFTFWFIFKDQDINGLITNIKSTNKIYISIAALMGFTFYLIEAINVRSLLITLGEKKFSIFRSLRYTAIGAFFSAITPAASGGQPIEIYYMSKDGIKVSNSTLALLIHLCGFQMSTIGCSLVCVIINPSVISGGTIWLYILGIVINGFILTIMLICIFSKTLRNGLFKFILKMLRAFKVKNYELKKAKIEESLKQYSESSIFIKSHMGTFIIAVLRTLLMVIIYHLIPFFVYKSFGLSGTSIFKMFTVQAILYTTVSGLPLPGAIGVSEGLFLKIYESIFTSGILSGAMLVYRFVSFYLYILIFFVIVVITVFTTKNKLGDVDKDINDVE